MSIPDTRGSCLKAKHPQQSPTGQRRWPVPRLVGMVAAALIAALGPAGVAAAAAQARPAGVKPAVAAGSLVKIMPLGDSITAGTGSSTNSSYRADLYDRLVTDAGFAVDYVGSQETGTMPDTDNEGHSGWRIDQIAANIDGWLATYQPDVVLIHLGTNDMNQNYQVGTAPQRLAALVDHIRHDRPAAQILVAKIVPSQTAATQTRIAAFNAALPAALSGRPQVQLVDMSTLSSTSDMHDALHPNDAGYVKMATRWYIGLESVLGDGRDWPLLRTGFETSEPATTWSDSVANTANLSGYCCSLTGMQASVRSEPAHSGTAELMYSGNDLSTTKSYGYARVFSTDLPVSSNTTLSYWVYPQQQMGTSVAIDLQFADGSSLRDSGVVDQYGVRVHPQFQGEGGHLVVNQWNLVRVSLASLAGRRITRVDVGYDQPANTGLFRGLVDDLRISDDYLPWVGANLALKATATGTSACATAEDPSHAVDGVTAGDSKFCSQVAAPSLVVDLGANHTVRRLLVRHAATGGERLSWNTRDFTIATSTDGVNWSTAVTVVGNAQSITINNIADTPARYLRLDATTPSQDGNAAARVYELEAYGE